MVSPGRRGGVIDRVMVSPHVLTLARTHTYSLTLSLFHSLALSLSHSLTLAHTLSHPRSTLGSRFRFEEQNGIEKALVSRKEHTLVENN